MLLRGSVIHSTKLTTAVCTRRCTLARCDASSSAKNGNLSCIAATASVANRPEYCLSLRSSDSGTFSRSSSVDRGAAGPVTWERSWANRVLSGTPKIYATFLVSSSNGLRHAGVRRLLRCGQYVVDLVALCSLHRYR